MKKTKLKVITNEKDHRRALEAIAQLWDAKPGSEAHDTLGVLALLDELHIPMEALIPRLPE